MVTKNIAPSFLFIPIAFSLWIGYHHAQDPLLATGDARRHVTYTVIYLLNLYPALPASSVREGYNLHTCHLYQTLHLLLSVAHLFFDCSLQQIDYLADY